MHLVCNMPMYLHKVCLKRGNWNCQWKRSTCASYLLTWSRGLEQRYACGLHGGLHGVGATNAAFPVIGQRRALESGLLGRRLSRSKARLAQYKPVLSVKSLAQLPKSDESGWYQS